MKKETFFDYKNWIFQSPKNRILFSKGLTHAFRQNMPIFSLFKFDQTKPRNNAFWLCREKKTFFGLKKQNFSKSKKSHFFREITHAFGEKNANYLFYLDLVEIRLEIMLGDFAAKKETFLTIKNRVFPKNLIFSKSLTHAFSQNMSIFRLFRFG